MLQRLALTVIALALTACPRPDPTFVLIGDYEGPVGEAVVRHVIKGLPDLLPGTPKEYCVITGGLFKAEHPHAVDPDFTKRMDDLGLRFISADVLIEAPPNHDIIDPITRISPYIIQLTTMRRSEPTVWDVEIGWSFLKTFERRRLRVRTDIENKVLGIEEVQRVEGNYTPAPTTAPAAK